ncbi:MAG: argininosuccinate lyase [Verrucomicrobiota bacterium]|nr:argininosuccinate lyase [Verrucomicrobiota bacterium]
MRAGRFSTPLGDLALRYSESVSFDWRLYRHDIAGSIAHAAALAAAGILTSTEEAQIVAGLREIESEIAAGEFEWDRSLEDLHMNIEAALTKRIGAAGAKLHTARSRNDQVALDLRLYTKAETTAVGQAIQKLQRAIVDLAQLNAAVVMPGYTHLQRAQPVLFAHYLLGVVEALARDVDRFNDCGKRADVMPLGSGAIAGSTIVLDRALIAERLGFASLSRNSMDAVGDRDFVCEFLFCLATVGMHLSRLSEDLILWSTSEFGFITGSDDFSTGSSLMPQKKNPDMAELTRGKTGRLYGNLMAVLTTMKGLPSSYNRDLQEDKQPLFDSVDTVSTALSVFAAMMPALIIHAERMQVAASDPNLLATDLAEYLVKKGVPFREAHAAVGKLVAAAGAAGVALDRVSREQLRSASDQFGDDVASVFNVRESLRQRTAVGGPSPENVAHEIEAWRARLRE